jgi:hypothetical protein
LTAPSAVVNKFPRSTVSAAIAPRCLPPTRHLISLLHQIHSGGQSLWQSGSPLSDALTDQQTTNRLRRRECQRRFVIVRPCRRKLQVPTSTLCYHTQSTCVPCRAQRGTGAEAVGCRHAVRRVLASSRPCRRHDFCAACPGSAPKVLICGTTHDLQHTARRISCGGAGATGQRFCPR